jgi:hypothetical protein
MLVSLDSFLINHSNYIRNIELANFAIHGRSLHRIEPKRIQKNADHISINANILLHF